MSDHHKKKNISLVFIIFLTSFLFWVFTTLFITQKYQFSLWNNHEKTQIWSIFSNTKDLNLGKFWEVYDIIQENNYSEDPVKKQDLVDGAIDGMVEWLGDPFSEYLSPTETEQFQEALAGDFEWIGAVVLKHPLWVEIDRVIKWSPAKKYDIRKWDIVVQADDHKLKGLNLYNAIEYIKWPAGSSVVLQVLRQSEQDILSITVVREKIKIPSVHSEELTDDIGYISINMFGQDTAKEFKKAIKEFHNKPGIIIDLRDNGGGYLTSAVEILSHFVERGETLVTTKHKESFYNANYKSTWLWERYTWKIVVLINENSASASEITAATLREYDQAILVWETTYGKGSVQQPFEMNDGSLVKLTIAKWFTPEGKNINKIWLDPDLVIKIQEEDYENTFDRQKNIAEQVLKDFIEFGSIWLAVDKNQPSE